MIINWLGFETSRGRPARQPPASLAKLVRLVRHQRAANELSSVSQAKAAPSLAPAAGISQI